MAWLHLHNFMKGAAQKLVNQLKDVIIVDSVVSGYIQKSTIDTVVDDEKKKKKKHRHKHQHKQDSDADKAEKKDDPKHEFFILVKYVLHLQSEYEDTFLSLFVPCTKFCLGWEPLLDKKYTLKYQMKMVRLRGHQEVKWKSNIDDIEAAIPSQSATKEKTFGDKIGDFVSSITGKKDDDKKKKKRKRRRKKRRRENIVIEGTGDIGDIDIGNIAMIRVQEVIRVRVVRIVVMRIVRMKENIAKNTVIITINQSLWSNRKAMINPK